MIFLYGPLVSAPLRNAILGREVALTEGQITGWRAALLSDGAAALTQREGATTEGGFFLPEADDMARLGFYAEALGLKIAEIGGGQRSLVSAGPETGEDWRPEDAPPARLRLLAEAAAAHMSRFSMPSASPRFYPQTVQRVASVLRAKAAGARRGIRLGGGLIQTVAARQPYRAFFEVAEHDIRYPRFDGRASGTTTRAAFIMADAVTVLPYDPQTDRVMLVEQFRMGPHLRGDPLPWTLEPVAGRIDGDEPPEDCARREAMEEAGIALSRVLPVANYYPTAGAVTEYLYSFIGLAELPLSAAGTGGLAEEEEDIRAHILSFDRAMAMLDRGEIETAPLVISLLYLARIRDRLRAEASGVADRF